MTVIEYNNPLGAAKVNEVVEWLTENVGEDDVEWGWVGYCIHIYNSDKFNIDDRLVFKLKFGI